MTLLSLLAAPVAVTCAQSFDASTVHLLQRIHDQPNDLARYVYLLQVTPSLRPSDHALAAQFRSFAQCELGMYTQAVVGFPLTARLPDDFSAPTASAWRGAPAVDAIADLARSRRLVVINEAHHNAHTRRLTLALLPRLRALGFNYFAAEALLRTDTELGHRGYPVQSSGTEYLGEPLYGDIVRTALQLGFHVVAYDEGNAGQAREDAQARNLYQVVFAHDPGARLFVHAGYAHIDKVPDRLGSIEPMVMRLQKLSGIQALSIDQTDIVESDWNPDDAWHRLAAAFPSAQPQVLLRRDGGMPWSARPAAYDISVLLPPGLSMAAFGDLHAYGGEMGSKLKSLETTIRSPLAAKSGNFMQRPTWLTLDGVRRALPISVTLCRGTVPCVVEARYAAETDDAITADRYAFINDHAASTLYLRPGSYRLRASDVRGRTLSTQTVTIAGN
ncbi:MAG: hypothetical protein ABI300_11680 [Rhodanobacter sp.]